MYLFPSRNITFGQTLENDGRVDFDTAVYNCQKAD